MTDQRIRANLNLYAVLKNLEDLVAYDSEMGAFAKEWDISVQFVVHSGPKACIVFKNASCIVEQGTRDAPTVMLFFISPGHLNKMMDGKGTPIPLRGFSKLRFLTQEFSKLTDKLEYYLKPTDELLENPLYLELNTRMMLNTAAFSVPHIGDLDPVG